MNHRIFALSPVLAAALTACTSLPASPTLEIGPANATTVDELRLSVTDAPELEELLTYSVEWSLDGEAVADLTDSKAVPADRTLKGQTWSVVVTPFDDKDNAGDAVTAEITVLNTAPVAELSVVDDVALTSDDLVATATSKDVDGDAVTYSWVWLRDGEKTTFGDNTVPAAETHKGEVWTVRVTPADDEVKGDAVEAVISIDNSLPVAAGVTLDPTDPTEDSTIVATATGDDADGDTLTWTYVWSVDGEALDVTGPEIDGASFSKGQTVSVAATPSDAFASGNTVTSEVIVLNTAPSVKTAQVNPSEVRAGQSLNCDATGWDDADGDKEAYKYDWTVNGDVIGHDTSLTGPTFGKGDAVGCVLRPWDGEDEGAPVSSETVLVLNTAPVLASVALDKRSPKTDDVLIATAKGASDLDEDVVSYKYDWSVEGKTVFSETTSSSTSRLDGASWFDKGDKIAVVVTPYDGDEYGAAVTDSATATNSAPTVGAVTLDKSSVKTDDVLTATVTDVLDADGDTVTLTWNWSVNGAKVYTATGATSELDGASWFVSGDSIQVTATPNDGTVSGAAGVSGVASVVNTLPTVSSVSFDLAHPATNDVLTATVAASDADSDTITFDYVWSVDGTTVQTDTTTSTTATLSGGAMFDKGQEVTVVVTPKDPTGSGSAVSGPKVTVVNSAPQAASAAFVDTAPKTNDDLVVEVAGGGDADGDTISYRYKWSVNGTEVFSETITAAESTLAGATWFKKGDEIVVAIVPTDTIDDGTTLTAAKATVANTAPSVSRANVTPGTLYTTSTAAADVGYSDPDGDSMTLSYVWTVDGSSAGTSSTLASSAFFKSDVVAYTVKVDDGTDSASLSATGVTVSNSAPTAPSVAITPAAPDDADDLVCGVTVAGTDADGDTLSYDIDWYKNDVLWTGSTYDTTISGDTIDSADLTAGEGWHCVVTSWDGAAASADATATKVTVKSSVGMTGVLSGDPWVVCRTGTSDAWLAANKGGSYNATVACASLGYTSVSEWGGTCGTVCGYCGTPGDEKYDGSGGSAPSKLGYTVHWHCVK